MPCRSRLPLLSALVLLCSICMSAQNSAPEIIRLEHNWFIRSSADFTGSGETISRPGFPTAGWLATKVPSTVFAARVNAGVYKDPFFGMNFRQVPGVTYPIGSVFSREDMPADSPYRVAWWYRTEFLLPSSLKERRVTLHFNGIGYRANIWVNGRQIADSSQVVGFYRQYQFDVEKELRPGVPNVIAVQVFPANSQDLGYNWVDWNPSPPDKEMGLWREAYLEFGGPVQILHPFVSSEVDPSLESAALTAIAELRNAADHDVTGTLKASMPGLELEQSVTLKAGELRQVTFSPQAYKQLVLRNPKLWWPAQMGTPALHTIHFEFSSHGQLSDRASLRFGIRQITSEITPQGARLFRINGKPILIRGGGWAPDMMLRFNRKRLEQQLRYVLDMNLNTIRLEGKMEDPDLYDLADQYGILVMAGWCCCDLWEQWDKWTPEDHAVAYESLRSQIYELRGHPSVFVWLNGSDNPPADEVESQYLEIEKELSWPNPVIASATARGSNVGEKTGVKMTGPYDYVPPGYWEEDKDKLGGAWGFNTETSAGAAPLTLKSLRRTVPPDHLWPVDDVWNFHAGGGAFKNIQRFQNAMNQRYGAPKDVVEFTNKGQAMAYENVRAMFEAYSRNKYASTGVIQWMLNNAWPGMIWHLYDYYLMPDAGYFAAKKANEPVHAQYSYDDDSVVVVNSTYQAVAGLKLNVRVFDFALNQKYSSSATVNVDADAVAHPLTLPRLPGLSTTYFVRVELSNPAGKILSTNFYWLSTKHDIVDYTKHTFYDSPVVEWGDLSMMNSLPAVTPQVHATLSRSDETAHVRVVLHNTSKSLLFMTHLSIAKGRGGEDVAPILWSDNYVSLLPGERRELAASFDARELGTSPAVLELEGWNTKPALVPLIEQEAR